jgi:hypothetical protein
MHALRRLFAFRFLLPSVFLLFATAAILSFSRGPTQQAAATYTHGSLSVTIPYHSAH